MKPTIFAMLLAMLTSLGGIMPVFAAQSTAASGQTTNAESAVYERDDDDEDYEDDDYDDDRDDQDGDYDDDDDDR